MSAAGALSLVTVPVRRWLGIGIVAIAVGGTAVAAGFHRHALEASYVVPFARGDRPADGSDAVEAQAASFLKAYPGYRVQVTGFTEPGGDAQADVALSERRAQVVRDTLEADGVARDRMAVVGGGSSEKPAREADDTDASYARRQARVVVKVTGD